LINVIDLFAGCGGLSLGFEKAGFNIKYAVEYDGEIAYTYKQNHPETKVFVDDIKNIDNDNVFQNKGAEIIIGGPPCQGFSMAGARIRANFIDDPRNYLFKHYFNVVKIVRPSLFVLENVKGLLTMKNGQIFDEIKKVFEDADNFGGRPYKIQFQTFNASDYGIPQSRERVIVFGSLIDVNLQEEIKKTKDYITKKIDRDFFNKVTVWDAIANLPYPSNDGKILCPCPASNYQKYISSSNDFIYNHIVTKHNETAIRRMKQIKINSNYKSLEEEIKSVHSGSYGRLDPNGLAPTITTRFDTPSGGKFIHPYCDRTLTPREAARIQSFPDDFTFYGTKTSIHKQIGNAVPPKMAFFLGVMIRRILCKEHSKID